MQIGTKDNALEHIIAYVKECIELEERYLRQCPGLKCKDTEHHEAEMAIWDIILRNLNPENKDSPLFQELVSKGLAPKGGLVAAPVKRAPIEILGHAIDVNYEKYVNEDGLVGIVLADRAGWSTDCFTNDPFIREKMLFDKRIVEAVLEDTYDDDFLGLMSRVFEIPRIFASELFYKINDLEVEWLVPGSRFTVISNAEGHEWTIVERSLNYTA